MKIEAKASISPDKGDDRWGVNVQLQGHRTWMTQAEAQELIDLAKTALDRSKDITWSLRS